MTHRSIVFWSTPYTFSGKEKDVESGYGYFGARYYDSGLSIWLSVDPMSDKYPSMSPYNYCANNPVILVDPDGRNYETVIEGNTITIKATYYTTNKNKDRLQKAVDFWNGQSGKYEMVVGEGENQKTYTVNFELTVAQGDYESNVDYSKEFEGKTSNEFLVTNENFGDPGNLGETENGNNIRVKTYASARVDAHEIGHTLGIGESSTGLMVPDQSSISSSDQITQGHVGAILCRSGFLNTTFTPSYFDAKTNVKSIQVGYLRFNQNQKNNLKGKYEKFNTKI
jgi:RHS repeat-associated protein